MKKLTIATSNRNRLDISTNITKFFIKSLEMQTCKDFEVVIADGGSDNFEELEDFFSKREELPKIRIVKFKIGEKFERARLNNVAIRNSNSDYVLTTDADMFFAPTFVSEVLGEMDESTFLESRTLYWKPRTANSIWEGLVDPYEDMECCRIGRIMKRTTAGGCQCTHIKNWEKLRGFNEEMVGWGSEDVELLKRADRMKLKIKWIGESRESISVFHQPHSKISVKDDLECQRLNKRVYGKSEQRLVNLNGWGGKE